MCKNLETALPGVDMPVCGELGSLALPVKVLSSQT